jgi:RNA polymerase sigma-70 factor, ECF subfamily
MPADGLELLRRISGGDRDALSEFYDAYAPLAFGLIHRILAGAGEGEVVLEEVFSEIWQSASAYDPRRGSPAAWVVLRARRCGIRRLSPGCRSGEPLAGPEAPASPLAPGRGGAHGGAAPDAVHRLLRQVAPEQREIIDLTYFRGLTQAEVSERTGQTLGTTRTRLWLGMEELRRLVDPLLPMGTFRDSFSELTAAHALGSLCGDELTRWQAHVAAGCAPCERALDNYREALAGLAAELREPPPVRVKLQLMARVSRGRAGGGGGGRFWSGLRWTASVAVAAGFVASLVATWVSARYEARLGQLAREVTALHGQVSEQRLGLLLLRDPATQIVPLAGRGPSPRARGRMIWNRHEGGLFAASDLPPAPAERAYELWAITGTKAVPTGIFTVDADGRGSLRVAPLEGAPPVGRFTVTLEPTPGVPAPTGPLYLASP